jgi:hypothetical protein
LLIFWRAPDSWDTGYQNTNLQKYSHNPFNLAPQLLILIICHALRYVNYPNPKNGTSELTEWSGAGTPKNLVAYRHRGAARVFLPHQNQDSQHQGLFDEASRWFGGNWIDLRVKRGMRNTKTWERRSDGNGKEGIEEGWREVHDFIGREDGRRREGDGGMEGASSMTALRNCWTNSTDATRHPSGVNYMKEGYEGDLVVVVRGRCGFP